MTNNNEIIRWFSDNGDYTHNLNYDLNENSVVIDLGGYTGEWAQQIINKYNPNIFIIEPVTKFYDIMISKFSNNNKVHLMNVAAAIENKEGFLHINGDSTSSLLKNGTALNIQYKSIDTILKIWNLDKVDLIQINIEGDEYELLDYMIQTDLISMFENIQIQFHLFVEDAVTKRENIRKGLINKGFKNKFDYPFVWESWSKN